VTRQCLATHAREEARRYRWLQIEKAGCDLGEAALRDWNHRHWPSFCRHRWVEHLEGHIFWEGFDEGHFGLLDEAAFTAPAEVVEMILDRLRQGGENLDIIVWAFEEGHEVSDVIEVLERLDINAQHDTWLSP